MFNVIFKLRDNLPSSFLDATFGERVRLFKPNHIRKCICVFSMESLSQRLYNHSYHRLVKLRSSALKLEKNSVLNSLLTM